MALHRAATPSLLGGTPLRTQRDPLCPDMQAWESGLYSTVVIWSRSFGHFRFRERGYLLTIYKYKYLYYSGGFDSIRFRF